MTSIKRNFQISKSSNRPLPIFLSFNSIQQNRQCRPFPGVERFIIGLIKESVSLTIRFVIKIRWNSFREWVLLSRETMATGCWLTEVRRWKSWRGTKKGRWRGEWRKRRRGWLLLGARLQRSAEFFSRIRAKFLPGLLDDTEECRRRLVEWMAGMPTLLEESCSMTLHPDCLRPLWSMGVRLCAAWMSRVRIPFDGSSTQGFAGLCAWDMGIMDYRVFLGVVWGFERDIYIYRK